MIYVLYGKIEYLIKKEIDKIINENKTNDIEKFDLINVSINKVINAASSISLFSNQKIIIINNAIIFTSKSKDDTTELEKYLNNINKDTILIFIINCEKLDERKKITKLAKKIGYVKEFNEINTSEIVKKLFANYNISQDNVKYLIERIGDNIDLLNSEIEKIKIYKNKDLDITKEDIDNLTNKSFEVNNFKLIDAIINKDKSKAFELYNERIKLNEEPIAIIITIANQIRIMYQVKELYTSGYTENDIVKVLGIHPYRIKLAIQNGRKYASNVLLNYLYKLSDLDINIKTGKIDKNLGLELFILEL